MARPWRPKTSSKAISVSETLPDFCCAKLASIPDYPVITSIDPKQSRDRGKSSYGAEIDRLAEIISLLHSRKACVIIDEILKGTNTIERISASATILDEVAESQALVFVTIHDIEIGSVTKNSFDMLHFAETGEIEDLFDYKLRDGPVMTRNAIRLLETIGFSKKITDSARENIKIVEMMYPNDYRNSVD